MSRIQQYLDAVLRSRRFVSVTDLQHIECDSVVYVQRKTGHKSVLVDVSGCDDVGAVDRVLATKAVY